jgi:hypothetical protein
MLRLLYLKGCIDSCQKFKRSLSPLKTDQERKHRLIALQAAKTRKNSTKPSRILLKFPHQQQQISISHDLQEVRYQMKSQKLRLSTEKFYFQNEGSVVKAYLLAKN